MVLKLITQIKKEIDSGAFPELMLCEKADIPNGIYYEFEYNHNRFSLIMQDFKQGPKLNWVFFRNLTQDEREYWQGKYSFKIDNDIRYTKSTLRIGTIETPGDVKCIMCRTVGTLRVFLRDLKSIIIMFKNEVIHA